MVYAQGFSPFVFRKKRKESLICPPYDVISKKLQAQLYKKSPFNIVRAVFGKTYPTDNEKNNRYTRAKKFFLQAIEKRILIKIPEGVFLLKEKFSWQNKNFVRLGVIVRLNWEKTNPRAIIPHEKTYSAPKKDRFNLLKEVPYNFSPVFLLTQGLDAELKNALKNSKKLFDYNFEGVFCEVFRVKDIFKERILKTLRGKKFVIADGHHRLQTSFKFFEKNPQAKFQMVYITDFLSQGCLIFQNSEKKELISKTLIEEVLRKRVILPQKSTYFWPKLASGVLIHPVFEERKG